jgi:peptide/nickel transport system permease protein
MPYYYMVLADGPTTPEAALPADDKPNGARRTVSAASQHPMLRTIARRLLLSIPLLFVVSSLSFFLLSLTPGDATSVLVGADATQGAVGTAAYEKVRHQLGLDRPAYQQYWDWLKRAVHGDLGRSLVSGQPVTTTIKELFPTSFSLIMGALLVISVLGVGLGVLSAVRGGFAGRVVDALSLVGFALPGFWVGAVLIGFFAVRLGWFPTFGYVKFQTSPADWAKSLVLPVTALALHGVAVLAKQTREAMLDVLSSEHVRMALANGMPPRYTFFLLPLKNVAIRVVTILGLTAIGLLAGTLFVEQVFALPGLGSGLVTATVQHDLPVVQGIAVFFTLIIILINLVVDLTYSWLDPRVRTA